MGFPGPEQNQAGRGSMSQVSLEDYIQKVTLLERRVGAKTDYRILEPFPVNSGDIIAIQNIGKKIAEFIGLRGLTFIIATTRQKENVGGHIELVHGEKEVFIEISDDMLRFGDAVLATLGHEITHKYLHIHGISYVHGYENEVLTDIAAVFLGLGKLMLNGCECRIVRQENVPGGVREVTETHTGGYLDRRQLAAVYYLVCSMRRIPPAEYERGLCPDSIQALRECRRQYGPNINVRFHEPGIRKKMVENLHSAIRRSQSALFDIDKNLLYLQHSSVDVTEVFLEKAHRRLNALLSESRKMLGDNEHDPCLNFLNAMQLERTIAKMFSEVNNFSSDVNRYQNHTERLANLAQALGNPFLQPGPDMFTIVTCRNDGTKLRLPKDTARLIATCPECHYEFAADTSVPAAKQSRRGKTDSIMQKLSRKLFRGKKSP